MTYDDNCDDLKGLGGGEHLIGSSTFQEIFLSSAAMPSGPPGSTSRKAKGRKRKRFSIKMEDEIEENSAKRRNIAKISSRT